MMEMSMQMMERARPVKMKPPDQAQVPARANSFTPDTMHAQATTNRLTKQTRGCVYVAKAHCKSVAHHG